MKLQTGYKHTQEAKVKCGEAQVRRWANSSIYALFNGYDRKLLRSLATRFYQMKGRCERPTHPDYKWYGARGIECRFEDKMEFIAHVLTLPGGTNQELEVDRKDNDGDYEFGNLQMVTHKANTNNKRHRYQEQVKRRIAEGLEQLDQEGL